ncbi:MAG: phosphate ABC transporter permease PstA, partial [Stenotrophobium sp.]
MPDANSNLYRRRRLTHRTAMVLACLATSLGLIALAWILGTLVWKGAGGLSIAAFTQMTPPPGSAGGLLNAIYGSLVQTVVATLIGTPIGILAGTYMAEYGRNTRLT